ncbi:hypothetical protein LN042_23190 [Kitasatospora sp. RB6PN24]|uniref:hypothetical protein n=1 Tax=Kitasatospora humi TaxID=2893891 RepID=UPI001E28521A|nr:hypothetical protein [Kitasatospora humi]MCC9309942.1 hypothetical protein [Kitasatospora humi]
MLTLPQTLLPGLGLSLPMRLTALSTAGYLVVGTYATVISDHTAGWGRRWRREIGTSRSALVLATAVWMLAVLLWPVPLIRGTIRTRRSKAHAEDLVWHRPIPAPRATVTASPTIPQRPAYPPVPPRWYRAEYQAVRVVLTEGRTVIARIWVSNLIDDSLLTFGDEHPYTRWAWELLAEIVRTELDNLDRTGATLEPHGSSDPFGTILFPKGSGYTVVRDLDKVSVYRTGAGR